MYVATVPNRKSPPAILLRESYRDGSNVKTRTLANLSHWPGAQIEALRAVLHGATSVAVLEEAFAVSRSLPHGHVAAVVGTMRKLGLGRLINAHNTRGQQLCLAMIAARILHPSSKLALARRSRNSFDREFNADKALHKQLGVKYRSERDALAALLDNAAELMAQDKRRRIGKTVILKMDIGSTHTGGMNLYQHLIFTNSRHGNFLQFDTPLAGGSFH